MSKVKLAVTIFLLVAVVVVLGLMVKKEGVTGGTVIKGVTCYENADCEDQNLNTEDICRNAGTEYSLCVNRLLSQN